MNRRMLISAGVASLVAALWPRARVAEAATDPRAPATAGLYLLRLEPGQEGDTFQGAMAVAVSVVGTGTFRYLMVPASALGGATPLVGAQVRVTKVVG